jgi:hypothetical protein
MALAGTWPHERDGWTIGLNLGGGTAGIDVSGYSTDRETGAAGSLRVGHAFRSEFAVGLEGNAWTKEVDNETWTFSFGGPSFTFYPGSQGFYVRGGIGVGAVKYEAQSGGVTLSASDKGFGVLGGMGYEFRVARRFALGPQVDYSYAKIDDSLSINYWNFTLGGNWYF